MWLPGRGAAWFERNAGRLVAGGDAAAGAEFARAYALDEVPSFARAGAVLPTSPPPDGGAGVLGRAARGARDVLRFEVTVAGATAAAGELYEDDGATTAYYAAADADAAA